jgi:hypothetical protein
MVTKRPVKKVAPTKRAAPRPRPVDEDEYDESPVEADVEEDGDEETANRRSALREHIRPGWTAGQKEMEASSSFAQAFKPEEKVKAIKFLDDQPYASFRRHWVERTTKEGRITRAYTCLETIGEECPLCEIGERPQAVSAFNVAECGDDGQVLLRSWDVGPRLFQTLKGYANDPRIGPLTKGFYVVSKTGKKATTSYNVIPVRASMLEEDYDIPAPDQSLFDGLKPYTIDIINIPKLKEMEEIAQELADEL